MPWVAHAHFALRSPASWRVQDALGGPQKLGPCGDEAPAIATGIVTPFAPGETITITLDEAIFHPGHYRVALAVNDRSELPPEPLVTPGATACGSVPIMAPPVFPVLADGALAHTVPFSGMQSIQVTLPSNVTCTKCTLQVLEFMSDHAAPCFYHHCADISIGTTGGACTQDADCADSNACTTDRCRLDTSTCENPAIDPAACDDANVCTRDACASAQGCVAQALTLADVDGSFLGSLEVPACAGVPVPAAVERLFVKATALALRAAGKPPKAERLLARALKRLEGVMNRVAAAQARGLTADCAAALTAVVTQGQARLQCLLPGAT